MLTVTCLHALLVLRKVTLSIPFQNVDVLPLPNKCEIKIK